MSVENEVKNRVSTIRLRTWSLTLILIVCLVFYYLVDIVFNQTINWVDFIFIALIQILVNACFFPDGSIYGEKDKAFQNNKKSYNDNADKINENQLFGNLREYCKLDFEQRKARYIENRCSMIGITLEELEQLKQMTENEIKQLTRYEINGKFICFSKQKRKILYNLLFKVLPVKENSPEMIMSAIEDTTDGAIHNKANAYKARVYISVVLKAVLIGLLFAYISYTLRDGIGFEEVVSITMCFGALFSTAVLSFTKGERYSKVYLSEFYLELSTFISGFFEWTEKNNNNLVDIKVKE